MSAGLIWGIVAVAIVALAAWPVSVMLANRNPAGRRHPRAEHRRAQVQGGTHVGGGRSVAPRRDAEVIPDAAPEDPTVPVREDRRNSPMDL
jgi:hypothetical protein